MPARRPGAVVVAALLAAALLLPPAPAGAKFDPARRWRTAATEHFVVHFPEGGEAVAARAARIAEEVHAALAPRVGWAPRGKTRLLLSDDDDAAGGWASPYPYNQMLVTLAEPLEEPGFGATRLDDWLRLVITHEYTHVLQLDLASGLPLASRSVFGRLYFPNSLQPAWLVEGLATFEETELTPGGRGRSPGTEMVLRMATLAGRVPTLDQMAVAPDVWPGGSVPYLFGESLLRHVAARHGREGIAAISREYGGRLVPFLVESTGRRALGEGYRELWRAWKAGLEERFAAQARGIEAAGLTASTPLTGGGWNSLAPAWSPDGARIAWTRSGPDGSPGIWVMNADGSGARRVAKRVAPAPTSGAGIAWSPDGGRIYFTRLAPARGGGASLSDVWALDPASGREERVTRGLRARDPAPSPDGKRLALVTAAMGETRIALLDLAGPLPADAPDRLRTLVAAGPDQWAAPRWSPDGTRIAASVRRPDGTKDVVVLDAATGAVVAEVARDRALDGAPAWSADGRFLHLSSDRTGVFNLFAWEAATGWLRQVTNVLGGAFTPAPSPDGRRIAFASYGADGYDLHVTDVDPASWRPAPPFADPGPPAAAPGPPPPPLASTPYTPWSTILPRLWVPWVGTGATGGTLAGVETGGMDAAQRHFYLASALYGTDDDRLRWQLAYDYDGLEPTLSLSLADYDSVHGGFLRDASGASDYRERVRSYGIGASWSLGTYETAHRLSLGWRYRELSALVPLPPREGYAGPMPAVGSLGAVRAAWLLSDAERPPGSVSPERGRLVAVSLEGYHPAAGSDFTFARAAADWSEFLPLPARHHVLQARLFAGTSTGDAPPQRPWQIGGDSPGDVAYDAFTPAAHLRGYPPNAFRGASAALATLEYRFPIADVQRGGVSAPFFLRRAHGAVFAEAGDAWDGGFRIGDLKRSVGAEARLDCYLGYHLPATIRVGIASGLDERGTTSPTFSIWLSYGLGSITSLKTRNMERYHW